MVWTACISQESGNAGRRPGGTREAQDNRTALDQSIARRARYSFDRAIGEPLWQSNSRVEQGSLINGQPVFDSKRRTPESKGDLRSTRAGRTNLLQCGEARHPSITPTPLYGFKTTSGIWCCKDTTEQLFEARPVQV
ncbi:unnamed protein product [Cercospora beticola]|nr:unnamed protein product [Cercospora beticola]